tara:strand:+ start:306 stop:536 length:231 start_codon:yes stop_codon:yes gene_type:complete
MKSNKNKEKKIKEPNIESINQTLADAWAILEKIDSLDFNEEIDIDKINKEAEELLKKVEKEYKPIIDKINPDEGEK